VQIQTDSFEILETVVKIADGVVLIFAWCLLLLQWYRKNQTAVAICKFSHINFDHC
jgi:hypothetical protein